MNVKAAYEQLLGRELPEPSGSNPNVSTNCFCGQHAHDDAGNSCSINVENGGWYCHTTGNKGYLPQAVMIVQGIDFAAAKKYLKEQGVKDEPMAAPREVKEMPPIDARMRDAYVRALNNEREKREYAQKRLGWNPDTMKRFNLGWSKETNRYTIPIEDADGAIRNFRMYDPDSKGINKMISWKQGYGSPARLFPMSALKAQTLVICEGEKDCILMNQVLHTFGPDDWAAITGTGGAGTWRDAWSECFEGKDVVIIYDRDDAGMSASQMVASKLVQHALSIKVISLDISEPAGADVTNYFQDAGKGWDDLALLIHDTEAFTEETQRMRAERPPDEEVYEPHLAEASQDRFAHKRLKLKVMVAGKELAPFILPKDIAFQCDMKYGKSCDTCAGKQHNGLVEHSFEPTDPALVEMLRLGNHELQSWMRRQLGIVPKCPRTTLYVDSEQNVEEVTLVPELEFSDTDREYVSRTAYVSEHGVIPNQSYMMYGTTIPHPRSQHAVHFIPRTEPAQDSIDDFEMTEKKFQALMVFQPGTAQTVAEKFDEIARDLSLNVTKIYGRDDLIRGIELCYHTVLGFNFQGKATEKTWGDILIIGDTRTGKTETVQSLIYHYKLGEMSMGENTSFAGLVGGLKQGSNRQWSIHWGRIPLNNRRLLVIDEMSGLPLEVISNMSGIRSNGIAEMVKIETQRTAARTRLIWLSNPRADKSMAQYGFGVEAVKELVGRPEDIARFDFVVASATNEVDVEVINAFQHDEVEHIYTSDLCRMLVLWTWSRKPDHIVFTEEAVRTILNLATEQSRRYVSDGGIPLVEGGNQRVKLAKLAVAAACRMFSTTDGEMVIVTKEHAEYAAWFLDDCYSKASLDYSGWSEAKLMSRRVDPTITAEAEQWIRNHPEWAELWLQKDELRVDDFKTQFDLETKDARVEIFVPLAKMKMVEKGRMSSYTKTAMFVRLLKKVRDEGAIAGTTVSTNGNGAAPTDDTPAYKADLGNDPYSDIPF